MSDENFTPSIRDHDLLIRIDQKVADLSGKVDTLNTTVIKDLAALDMRVAKIENETIPKINARLAYWSGGLALIGVAIALFLKFYH